MDGQCLCESRWSGLGGVNAVLVLRARTRGGCFGCAPLEICALATVVLEMVALTAVLFTTVLPRTAVLAAKARGTVTEAMVCERRVRDSGRSMKTAP